MATDFYPIQKEAAKRHADAMKDRTFAERLRAYLDARPQITEAGLAKAAGLDNSTIRKLLDGTNQNPRFDTGMKICHALGLTVEEFMGEAQTEEERHIQRLVSRLPVDLRRQLLGYADALVDAAHPPLPESSPTDQ